MPTPQAITRSDDKPADLAKFRPILSALVPPMKKAAEERATAQAQGLIAAACANLETELGGEFERLSALKRVNPSVRDSEIEAMAFQLTVDGWFVEFEGHLLRTAGELTVEVQSGIDWFDLGASLSFGDGVSASLPELLAAVKRWLDEGGLNWRFARFQIDAAARILECRATGAQPIRHDGVWPTVAFRRFLQELQGGLAIPGLGGEAFQFLTPP